MVDPRLLFAIKTEQRFCNFSVDVFNRLQHAPAKVALGIAIAQLDGFA